VCPDVLAHRLQLVGERGERSEAGLLAERGAGLPQRIEPFFDDLPGRVLVRQHEDGGTGYLTQTWLAVSNDAAASVSGGYWYHRQRHTPAPEAGDPALQDQLMDRLATLTGVALV